MACDSCVYYNNPCEIHRLMRDNRVCSEYERKPTSTRIEINVKINDKPATLADVSLETLTGMREKAVLTPEPIKHGDYGYYLGGCNRHSRAFRLFVKGGNGKIESYSEAGKKMQGDANDTPGFDLLYIITGNIFEDMEKTDVQP